MGLLGRCGTLLSRLWRVGNSVKERVVYKDERHRPILISTTTSYLMIGNEAAL
jgi:hypothetical protein